MIYYLTIDIQMERRGIHNYLQIVIITFKLLHITIVIILIKSAHIKHISLFPQLSLNSYYAAVWLTNESRWLLIKTVLPSFSPVTRQTSLRNILHNHIYTHAHPHAHTQYAHTHSNTFAHARTTYSIFSICNRMENIELCICLKQNASTGVTSI